MNNFSSVTRQNMIELAKLSQQQKNQEQLKLKTEF